MRSRISLIIGLALITALLLVMIGGVTGSWQAGMPIPQQAVILNGEFSTDGGAVWQPLSDRQALRRADGEVIIRGNLDKELEEGWTLNIHLQHMQLEMVINGETVYAFGHEFAHLRPEWCTDQWLPVTVPAISPEDTFELRLNMQHPIAGNGRAFEQLADQMLIGEPHFLYQWSSAQDGAQRYFGQTLLVVGITLLGVSLAAAILKSPLKRILMYTALLAIGEGALWVIDVSQMADYVGGSLALYALGRSVCQILVMYSLLAGISELLLGRSRRPAVWLTRTNAVISLVFVLIALFSSTPLCRYEYIWGLIQLPFVPLMFLLCIPEIRQRRYTVRHRFFILAYMLVFAAMLLSAAAVLFNWPAGANAGKTVTGVVALIYAFALFLQLPASHNAVQNAKRMSEELSQNRIVLAMSQISTHFIFNVLNAISGLIKIDPELADAELVRFARYLRTNIDIMQEDKPISFEQEMEHVHNYVDLEQLRFDEKIDIDENYEVTDFMLPSLVVQPLVENAIKHGLLPKAEGGLIRLSTYRQGHEVVVEIADNGVGFHSRKTSTHNSVGLSNVRYRLEKMAGGRLEIESRPGIGTVAKAILPYQKGE